MRTNIHQYNFIIKALIMQNTFARHIAIIAHIFRNAYMIMPQTMFLGIIKIGSLFFWCGDWLGRRIDYDLADHASRVVEFVG